MYFSIFHFVKYNINKWIYWVIDINRRLMLFAVVVNYYLFINIVYVVLFCNIPSSIYIVQIFIPVYHNIYVLLYAWYTSLVTQNYYDYTHLNVSKVMVNLPLPFTTVLKCNGNIID